MKLVALILCDLMWQTGHCEDLLLMIFNNGNVMNWSIRIMRTNGFITL